MYGNSSSVLTELLPGSENQVLAMGATNPNWITSSSTTPTRQYVTTDTQFSTNSSSFVDVTSMTITLASGSGKSIVSFNSFYQQSGSSGFWRWECSTDGTQQESKITDQSSAKLSICLPYVTATNSSQTVKIQTKNDNGNTNYFAADGEGFSTIWSWEFT